MVKNRALTNYEFYLLLRHTPVYFILKAILVDTCNTRYVQHFVHDSSTRNKFIFNPKRQACYFSLFYFANIFTFRQQNPAIPPLQGKCKKRVTIQSISYYYSRIYAILFIVLQPLLTPHANVIILFIGREN